MGGQPSLVQLSASRIATSHQCIASHRIARRRGWWEEETSVLRAAGESLAGLARVGERGPWSRAESEDETGPPSQCNRSCWIRMVAGLI
jgi:hypothetical protein